MSQRPQRARRGPAVRLGEEAPPAGAPAPAPAAPLMPRAPRLPTGPTLTRNIGSRQSKALLELLDAASVGRAPGPFTEEEMEALGRGVGAAVPGRTAPTAAQVRTWMRNHWLAPGDAERKVPRTSRAQRALLRAAVEAHAHTGRDTDAQLAPLLAALHAAGAKRLGAAETRSKLRELERQQRERLERGAAAAASAPLDPEVPLLEQAQSLCRIIIGARFFSRFAPRARVFRARVMHARAARAC
jgi:hypothetical protein